MNQEQTILEICLDSVDSCIAAERGGAHRVELCADLDVGGTTPSAGMIAVSRMKIKIGLFVMIRPRGGNFCYDDVEFEVMKQDVVLAKQLGADGVVFGLLTRAGEIDLPRTRELALLARPMAVTFHRAFDVAADPVRSLDVIIEAGIERVLTSGQAASALEGADLIHDLVKRSGGRIHILAGVGITPDNAEEIRKKTGVHEIHVGSGACDRGGVSPSDGLFSPSSGRTVSPEKVARILRNLR